MTTKTNFGQLIKMHGSVQSVADDLGIKRGTLYQIIQGKNKPSLELSWRLADYLGISTDELRAYLEQ